VGGEGGAEYKNSKKRITPCLSVTILLECCKMNREVIIVIVT